MYSNFCAKNSLKYIFSSLKALGADELMSWSTADSERARHPICVRKARKRRQVLFYEIVETAQAILISYILIDGSAQAVSHIVGFISAWLKSLR